MAESITIPLIHIQNMLDEIAPSWIHVRLHELNSMLIRVQESVNYTLLQDFSETDEYIKFKLIKDDIRQFAYQVDDQLNTIEINIKSCRRWIHSDIPNVIKTLGIKYHKSKFLYNLKSLIDLVQKNKIIYSQINFEIRECKEELHHVSNDFSIDFEKRIFFLNPNSRDLIDKLLNKNNNNEAIIQIDLSKYYVYVKAIYDNISIRNYFQYVAWVSVTNRRTIYRNILKQLLTNDKEKIVHGLMAMNEDEIRKELMEVLKSYKCLIILTFDQVYHSTFDDENLFYHFDIPMKSKLLVIARNDYRKYNITSDYGWKLLKSITITNQDVKKDIHEFEEIGLDLIKKCNGVARQIIRIGGVLRENVSINHWKMVQRSLSYGFIHSSFEDDYIELSIQLKIMALCYDQLSIHMKACFLYFGQFWKGIDISTEMLYQMWMAEGIITAMDIAEEYLAKLAIMLLIDVQESIFSTSRRFVSCRIDDFVKHFCLLHNIIDIVIRPYVTIQKTLYGLNSSSNDGFRLSMKFDISSQEHGQADIDQEIMETFKFASKKLRSLFILKENGIQRTKIPFPSKICKKFKLLRVLKIENVEIHGGNLPKEIRALINLRFLSLEGSTFEGLPKTIGNFRFLQTLDLRVTEIIPRGVVVPNVLWKLKELRHLYLPICHQVPKGNDKLSLTGLNKLETLVNFDIDKVELTSVEWKGLRQIDVRVHGKKGICDVIDYINNSGDKLKETFLHASFSNFNYEESDVPIEDVFNCSKLDHFMVNWGRFDLNNFMVPSPFSSNVIELCLIRCQIREDPMPILGKFSRLRKLVLGKKTFIGTRMTFDYNSFPTLRHLKMENLMYLEELEIRETSMINLSYLEISYCLKLKMIPSGLMLLRNLTELKLQMPKNFNDKLRRQDENEGNDFKIVQHVPFIFLEDL